MARGFNTTLGSGTTDLILSAYTGSPTQITVAGWASRRANTARRLFSKETASTGDINLDHTDGTTSYDLFVEWTSGFAQWRITRPALDTLVHVAITYESATTNDPVMYLDGVSQTVTQVGGNPTGSRVTNSAGRGFGNRPPTPDRCWDGLLENWAIWDTIRSAADIAKLAAGYSPLYFPTNLVEYMPLIQGIASLKTTAPTVTGTAVQPGRFGIYPWRQTAFLTAS